MSLSKESAQLRISSNVGLVEISKNENVDECWTIKKNLRWLIFSIEVIFY